MTETHFTEEETDDSPAEAAEPAVESAPAAVGVTRMRRTLSSCKAIDWPTAPKAVTVNGETRKFSHKNGVLTVDIEGLPLGRPATVEITPK